MEETVQSLLNQLVKDTEKLVITYLDLLDLKFNERFGKLNQFEVNRLIYNFNVNNDEKNRNCLSLITQDGISEILDSFDPSVNEKLKKEAPILAKDRLCEWQGCKNIQQKDIERVAQSLYWRM